MPNVKYPGLVREVKSYRYIGFSEGRGNNCLSYPDHWPPFYNGGTNTPCDMLQGPCACGAWHSLEEWIPFNLEDQAKEML